MFKKFNHKLLPFGKSLGSAALYKTVPNEVTLYSNEEINYIKSTFELKKTIRNDYGLFSTKGFVKNQLVATLHGTFTNDFQNKKFNLEVQLKNTAFKPPVEFTIAGPFKFINHGEENKANITFENAFGAGTKCSVELIALTNIKTGDELLMDYGPKFSSYLSFLNKNSLEVTDETFLMFEKNLVSEYNKTILKGHIKPSGSVLNFQNFQEAYFLKRKKLIES